MDVLQPLGPAAVDEPTLGAMVARQLGVAGTVRLLDVEASVFPYALDAVTTAGRYLVRGRAQAERDVVPFGFFVKVVQSWSRSPLFRFVPEEHRERAADGVPWRTEPLAYRSDLADRLPPGLAMPRAAAVVDLDDSSAAIWLEELDVVPVPWDGTRYRRAAYLLGRLSGSADVAPLAGVGEYAWTLRDYLHGRLGIQVLPMLRDDGIWRHPLVAGAYDDALRERLREAADRVEELVEEAVALPHLPAHGDACPNNLLVVAGQDPDTFTLVDYGFWLPAPAGADLGQLLVGEVQLGRARADDLARRDAAQVEEYVRGLRDEGCAVSLDAVRRGHALHLLVMSGLSSIPFEHLGAPPTPELVRLAADRAAIARFALDRVDDTAGLPGPG